MCLILFALKKHSDYPLIIAANRDEYYERLTEPAQFWPDYPSLLAGRDMVAGGTWLGITKSGRFAAVTNVREPNEMTGLSRGELTKRYLLTTKSPEAYLAELRERQDDYPGFNLIVGSKLSLHYFSNRGKNNGKIDPGIYGLSNGTLNEDWPKVRDGKKELKDALNSKPDAGALMKILANNEVAADNELPSTGVSKDLERVLSSRFIHSMTYGTRCSTVILVDKRGQVTFHEKNFSGSHQQAMIKSFEFQII